MKILVTGGAGYIGSHAVYLLIDKGYDVIIVDNLSKGFKSNIHPNATFYQTDITDEFQMNEIFLKEKNIEGIMNFAGSIIVSESINKPLKYFKNNTYGVEILLTLATKFKIKYFIFSSTAAVYGEPIKVPIMESDIKSPVNPYGESKLAAEAIIRSWSKATNSNYVIFRYFNVAGAHANGKIGVRGEQLTHLLPCVIESAITQNVFKICGNDYQTNDGTCVRDFIHVVDLVEAHILGLEWSIKNNYSDIFNLGSESGYSVLEVLNTAINILKINISSIIVERRDGDPAILYANTDKAKLVLKWVPKLSLGEIIKSEYKFRNGDK